MGVRKGGYSFHNTNEKGSKKTRNVSKMYHQSAPLILDIVSVSYAHIFFSIQSIGQQIMISLQLYSQSNAN
jgi:hypothetical protein